MHMTSEKREALFAQRALRAYQLYIALAERETSVAFQESLNELAHVSRDQFDFWGRRSGVRGDMAVLKMPERVFFFMVRRVCGLRFTAKLIIKWEERGVMAYMHYCDTCPLDADTREVRVFIDRMQAIIANIKGTI